MNQNRNRKIAVGARYTMTPSPNLSPKKLCSLGVLLLFCGIGIMCIGFGVILFLDLTRRIDRTEYRWAGQPETDYRRIPPEWITYQQTAVFKCPAPGQPTCFAVQGDSAFIFGTAVPPALSFFDGEGTLLKTIDLPEKPRAAACTQTGKIMIAYSQHIALYSVEGDWEASPWYFGANSDVRSLVLTPDYLFAADTAKRCIYRWDTDGNLDLTFGEGFIVYAAPITMTYASQTDLLYIANPGKHRVEVFTLDGIEQPDLGWGEPSASLNGFAGCCNPIGLAMLGDGRILTVEKGIPRIKIYRTDGELDCVVAGANTLDVQPPELGRIPLEPRQQYFSAAVFSDGRIAVFDFRFGIIRIFSLRL